MGYRYRGVCNGCHCTHSDMLPAPGVPSDKILSHLYCPACHDRGRAVYPPPETSIKWILIEGAVWAVLVGLLAFAFGMLR